MLDEAMPLSEDLGDLRAMARFLVAEMKARAVLIERLRNQLAGHRAHRLEASSETAEQLQLALETDQDSATGQTQCQRSQRWLNSWRR